MAAACAMLVSACHRPPPRNPTSAPASLPALATDAVYVFNVVLPTRGGIKPGAATVVSARCADPTVCDVLLGPAERPTDVQVIGKAAGATTLTVEVDNPQLHAREHHAIAVTVVAAPVPQALVVGAPLPTASELALGDLRCELPATDDPMYISTRAMFEPRPKRSSADVRVFECRAPVDVAGTPRYRRCSGGCDRLQRELVIACAQVIDGAVAGLATLEHRHTAELGAHLVTTARDGRFDDGVCRTHARELRAARQRLAPG